MMGARLLSLFSKVLFSVGLVISPLLLFVVAESSYRDDLYPKIIGGVFCLYLIFAYISIHNPKFLYAVLFCVIIIGICGFFDARDVKQRNMGLCESVLSDPDCQRTQTAFVCGARSVYHMTDLPLSICENLSSKKEGAR